MIYGDISINNGPAVPGTLTIEREMITVESLAATKSDARWEYVDPAGHFHAYDRDGKLPTLLARTRHIDCDGVHLVPVMEDVCEGYDVTDYYCEICGAPVEPKRVPDHGPKLIPGREDWYVEVPVHAILGESVSVRIDADDVTYFGIAAGYSSSAEGGPNGVRIATKLGAAGPLGRRERPKVRA